MPLTESSWRSTNNTPHHAARASRGAAAFVAVASAMVLVATGSALAGGAADEDLFRVACNHGGDEFGFAIATDGDFNGDGVNDIAVGSPCMFVRKNDKVGAATVFSGANGRKLFSKKGIQFEQWFGAEVAFIPDINGDGRDELAVGSPGYDATELDDPAFPLIGRPGAGLVEVFQRRKRRLRIWGPDVRVSFGEQIVGLNDVDGDGRSDFAVSASRDRNPPELPNTRPGRVWIMSGRNGDFIDFRVGPRRGDRYARQLASAGDVDGDGITDLLVASKSANVFGVPDQGVVDTVSPVSLEEELVQVVGAKKDGIGSSVANAGDMDGDQVPDYIVGSINSDDTDGMVDPGLVTLFRSDGEPIWVRRDTKIQERADFGHAVANIGDVTGDGVNDFAVSALFQDAVARGRVANDAGRVVALDGVDGQEIWATDGTLPIQRFGHDIKGGIDWDLDHKGDVLVGAIGDAPKARRGAGSVKILSGKDGTVLREFAGRRGLETRTIVAAGFSATSAGVRSFKPDNRKGELRTDIFGTANVGEMSVDVLDDRGIRVDPKQVKVVVGAGSNSPSSMVEVYRLGSRSNLRTLFEAFPENPDWGANCAAGEIDLDDDEEDITCVQGDSDDGNVMARLFVRLDEGDDYFPIREFPVFAADDIYTEFDIDYPVNAGGATVAVGDIDRVGTANEKIVVGTSSGLPIVRIFDINGNLELEFLAYDPVDASGVDVYIADIDDDNTGEIITAPRRGQALIKAFRDDATRVHSGPQNIPVSILAEAEGHTEGARVAAADIDLDDVPEILVMTPAPTRLRHIQAFELNNEPVAGFDVYFPFGDSPFPGGDIAGTDKFTRN